MDRQPLRVLHCLWDGETGGAERAVYQLIRGQFQSGGVEPAIAFAQGHGPYWEAAKELGCPVIDLKVPHGRSLRSLPHVAQALRAHPIHHFHSAEPLLMLASLTCHRVRRVYTHRGGRFDYPLGRRLQYRATAWILRAGFDAFSGNTAHGAACASSLFGIDLNRFRVTYNGLEFSLLEPRRNKAEVREELGIDPEEFVLGTAANLRAWKRIDRLLRLVAEAEMKGIRLLILGDGPDRPRLEGLATQFALRERAVFAGIRRWVGDYLQVMDAFCLPSASGESFGNAAVEAMALGVPTIVFEDGGGLVEHIQSGRTGFVVADEDELRTAITRLIQDDELRTRLGSCGREAVLAKYTLTRAIERYDALYAAALRDHKGRTSLLGRARQRA